MLKFFRREAIITAIILAATIAIVFPAAYVVGGKTLGAYGDDGTLGSWFGSLFSELASGNGAIWFFALSPLAAISVLRLGIAAARRI